MSPGFRSLALREVFGYRDDWPVVSAARRSDVEGLIGAPAPLPAPGPQAGEEVAPRAGEPGTEHSDD